MARRHFGTDGVRGVANTGLTPEFAQRLGMAVGAKLGRGRVVIGRDTRVSGPMLEAALASGLASYGVDVTLIGVAPTPAVALVAQRQGFDFGVVISASHNPAADNGIKFFTSEGRKSPEALETEWEALMERVPGDVPRPSGAAVGTITTDPSLVDLYVDHLKAIVPEGLAGMTIAVDAAHGAASEIAPRVLRELGATVVTAHEGYEGAKINAEGGATKPETVQRLTVDSGADVGVAFDGDADRAVFSDDHGRLINGDRTMGIWAAHYQGRGELDPPVIVGTVMSNGGFEAYLTSRGVRLERTPVGDKYVTQKIDELGALLGGEQSGHLVFPRRQPSGDGLATALELFRVLKAEGRSSSAFYEDYAPWPQLMVNVAVASKDGWETAVAPELAQGEAELEGHGRLLVRPSGTQPMIRVMVEADDYGLRDRVADRIVDAMRERLGGEVHGRVDLTHALGD